MLRRVPILKGLNLRDSDINRPPDFARDLRNVEKNSKGEIVLRWGYEEVLSDTDIIDLFEYVGAEDDPDRGSLLALKSDGLYRLEGSSLVALPQGNTAGQPTWTAQTKPVEYNKVLYWNDPDFNVDLWKFDGYSTYRAGVPKPKVSNPSYSGTAGTYYFRVILKLYDPQGNVTYSDFESFTGTNAQISLDFSDLTDSYYNGFYQKYTKYVGTAEVTIDSGNLTFDLDPSSAGGASHNYVAGDYMLLTDVAGNSPRVPVKIDSVTSTTITFNATDVGSNSFVLYQESLAAGTKTGPCDLRYEVEVYRSTLEFSNYEKLGMDISGGPDGNEYFLNCIDSTTTVGFGAGSAILLNSGAPISTILNSVYDDTLIRVLPPKGKFLALYNEQMFVGNLGKNQPDFGYAQLVGNDTRLEDTIVWSDIATLSNGSSIETFLVNNIRPIGVSSDGAIKGIHGNDDSFVVHKEKQSYYVNGEFITNSLRIRKAMAEQTGAASHRSIRDVDGGHLYTTQKGIFLSIGGNKPVELSDIIEPLFREDALSLGTLELENAKSATDFLREKIYIYIPITGQEDGVIVVYDYYFKEWFLHDNIPADKGFQDVGITSTDLYFASSTKLYRRTLNTKEDDGSTITGFYWTGWFDLDAPTIVKKFVNFIIISLANSGWVATIKGYCNWNSTTEEASNTLDFTSANDVMDTQVLQVQANSASWKISNETDGGDLLITGYDVEYEGTQTKPKGDL